MPTVAFVALGVPEYLILGLVCMGFVGVAVAGVVLLLVLRRPREKQPGEDKRDG